jgi:hypothetical protein
MTGENLEYQIGKLTGQVTALVTQVSAMSSTIALLDERLRRNETNTTALMVKMSMIGVLSGAVGSVSIALVQHFIFK